MHTRPQGYLKPWLNTSKLVLLRSCHCHLAHVYCTSEVVLNLTLIGEHNSHLVCTDIDQDFSVECHDMPSSERFIHWQFIYVHLYSSLYICFLVTRVSQDLYGLTGYQIPTVKIRDKVSQFRITTNEIDVKQLVTVSF